MDKKILAENVKLRARVSKYQQELHRERQKNKDIAKSRDAYKSKNKELLSGQKTEESVKKTHQLKYSSTNN